MTDDKSWLTHWLHISCYKERFNTICKQSDICGPKTHSRRYAVSELVNEREGDTLELLIKRGHISVCDGNKKNSKKKIHISTSTSKKENYKHMTLISKWALHKAWEGKNNCLYKIS